MKENFLLYGLFCPFTNELKYIGITTRSLNTRLNEHLRMPTNYKIKLWLNQLKEKKYKPIIKLISEFNSYDELLNGEINEIKKYRDLGYNLFNLSDGGDINPMLGKTHTNESRKKISETHKGKKFTEERLMKYREEVKKRWKDDDWSRMMKKKFKNRNKRVGFRHSEETKHKISKTLKKNGYNIGNKYSLGKKHTDEFRKNRSILYSGENNPMFGKKLSEESLLKRKKTVTEKGIYKGKNNPNFKYDISYDELFDLFITQNKTANEISKIYNCKYETIRQKLKNFNITKPKSNIYNLDINDILNYKKKGLNLIEIGKIYGCSNKIISKFIKKHE